MMSLWSRVREWLNRPPVAAPAQATPVIGRRAQRRISIIGPDSGAALALARQLFEARREEFHPLQPASANPIALEFTPPAQDAPDDALRVSGTYVSGFHRAERQRLWELCIPRTLQVAPESQHSWKRSSDTIVMAWPE